MKIGIVTSKDNINCQCITYWYKPEYHESFNGVLVDIDEDTHQMLQMFDKMFDIEQNFLKGLLTGVKP